MKRFLQRSALITALVSSLAILQGCIDPKQEEREPPVNSRAEQSESGDPSVAEQEPVPAVHPEEDVDLIREILLLYGATREEPDESRMKTQIISLYYADAWTEPEELPPGAYFSWFLTTVWAEDLTDQELEERYTLPDREGWAFPQAIYESRIQNRFDVSTDYLRSDEALYHPEEGVYWLGSGGGIGARPFVELQSVRRVDDQLLFDITLKYEEEFTQDEAWQLAVRLEEDGGWKYQSWMGTDQAEKEAKEEAEQLAEEEEQARMEREAQAEAERIAAEEAAAVQARQQAEAAAQQPKSNTQSEPSMESDPASQPSSGLEDSGSQVKMEEPTSGKGKEQADRMGGVWVPEWEGWVFVDEIGDTVYIYKNGGSSVLGGEDIAIAKKYLN